MPGRRHPTYCVSCGRFIGLGYKDRLGRCCHGASDGQPSIREIIEERRAEKAAERAAER